MGHLTIELSLLFIGGFCLMLMISSFGGQTPFQSIIQDNFMKVYIYSTFTHTPPIWTFSNIFHIQHNVLFISPIALK
jgi:hypothetical protein